MHIGFRLFRQVEVYDVRDLIHVDAARRDIGRDQYTRLAGRKPRERTLPRILRFVAVQRLRDDPGFPGMRRHLIRAVLRAREHDGARNRGVGQKFVQLPQLAGLSRRRSHSA